MIWEVYALKYADRNSRTRRDSFLFDDNHDQPHAMDYFIWVLKYGKHVILVDTGYHSRAMFDALMRLGVTVRTGDIFGLHTWIRVTIGTRAHNEHFIRALTEALDA